MPISKLGANLLRYAVAKKVAKKAAESQSKAEADLISAMRAAGQETVSATLDSGANVKGTLVEGETVSYDFDRLKKQLTPAQWKKITVDVVDKTLLEAEVTVGNIDANVVAACSEVKPRKAFVKVSGDSFDDDEANAAARDVSLTANGRTKPAARRVKPSKKP